MSNGGLNINQHNVATALNAFFNNGGTLPPQFVTVFGLTGANLGNALTQLSGETATGMQQAGFQSMDLFLNAMLDPFVAGRGAAGGFGAAMPYASEQPASPAASSAFAMFTKAPPKPTTIDERWGMWGAAYGGYNSVNGDPVVGSHDAITRTGGFASGADYHVSRDTVLGAAVAADETHWGVGGGLGTGSTEAARVGLYGSTRVNAAYLSAAVASAWHRASTTRIVSIGSVDALNADFDASVLGARLEGGYRFGTPAFGVTPYGALQLQSVHRLAYAERGATTTFALTYADDTANDRHSELGAWLDTRYRLDNGSTLLLRGRGAWVHRFDAGRDILAGFQTLPGANFAVTGAIAARDAALTSAAAELRLHNGFTLIAKFDGQFADGSHTYAGTATLRKAW